MGYWEDRCPSCGHARRYHGEGGCTAAPSPFAALLRMLARSSDPRAGRCGCRVSQGALMKAYPPEGYR